MVDKKFVIVSPRQRSGGAIVLHTLCKYLTYKGYDTRIFYTGINEYRRKKKYQFWLKWIGYTIKDIIKICAVKIIGEEKLADKPKFCGYINIPIKGCKRKYLPFVDKTTIVVYPEAIYGNFLKAKNVVRWFLYYNRFPNDENAYGRNDLFICYREIFNDAALNPDCNIVQMSYFDLDLYKRTNYGERKGVCYVIRKGKKRSDLPKKFDGIIIDNLPEHEKVRVFNESEYCISYDTHTAYSAIAALCGCISVIVPEPGKNRSDYRSSNETSYGVAFGFSNDELEYAKNTAGLLKQRYMNLNDKGKEDANHFIELCKEHFGF